MLGALGRGIDGEAAREGIECLLRVAQPLAVQLTDPDQQPDLGRRLTLGAKLDLVDLDQVLPLALRLVDRLEDAGGGERVLAVETPLERSARAVMAGLDL